MGKQLTVPLLSVNLGKVATMTYPSSLQSLRGVSSSQHIVDFNGTFCFRFLAARSKLKGIVTWEGNQSASFMLAFKNVPSFTAIFSPIFWTRRNPAVAFILLLPLHLNLFFASPSSRSSSLSFPLNNSSSTWLSTLSGSGIVYLKMDR
jgi:hypothetical protein